MKDMSFSRTVIPMMVDCLVLALGGAAYLARISQSLSVPHFSP
jgi:hypothetical protein